MMKLSQISKIVSPYINNWIAISKRLEPLRTIGVKSNVDKIVLSDSDEVLSQEKLHERRDYELGIGKSSQLIANILDAATPELS